MWGTVQEAASRELVEEINLFVPPGEFLLYGVLSLPDLNEVYISLAAALPNHDYEPSAEAAEVRMVSRDEMASLELGYPPASLAPLLDTYDAIARGDMGRTLGRMWDIRGRDPLAETPE